MRWFQSIEKGIPERLRPYFTVYVVVGLIVCIVSLLIFGNIVDGVTENESIVQFDTALANALHNEATPTSTSFFITVSLFGGTILFVWAAGVAIVLAWQRQWLALVIWFVTIGGGQLLNMVLKEFFARPRPTFTSPLVIAQYYSFPSGHAMMSFIAYGMLAYLICLVLKNNAQRLVVILLASFIVILIGISRMTLGVHYFSDVIAGYSVAALWLFICISAWRYVHQRRANPSPTT